ncbi:MAG: ChbG/HpnK family deacetylase [Chloroflexi bacterium]|nr:ChbG/HpnK family deacetylase [Chloroflexota bacterium]
MRRLIVNADDYGVTPGVCQGIRRAHREGAVTTTTAMMNMPHAAAELLRAHQETPALGLGVHLTLTAGAPLSPAQAMTSLIDPAGRFVRPPEFVVRLESLRMDEVEREWIAQIEAFLDLGLPLDHLDSHHHTSYLSPRLLDLMLDLAQRFGCAVRPAVTDEQSPLAREMIARFAPEGVAHALAAMRSTPVRHADRLYVSFYDTTATLERLLAIVGSLPEGTSEIMCHPGLVDEALRKASGYAEARQRELHCLIDPAVRQAIAGRGIRLCRYADVTDA